MAISFQLSAFSLNNNQCIKQITFRFAKLTFKIPLSPPLEKGDFFNDSKIFPPFLKGG